MEAKGNPYREAAVQELVKINQNKEERYLYLSREMEIMDEQSRLQSAKAEGRVEALLDLLGEYGVLSSKLREKIMTQTDLDTLRKWTKLAARIESLSEFEAAILRN